MTKRAYLLAAVVLLAALAGCAAEEGEGTETPQPDGGVPDGSLVSDGDVQEGVTVIVDRQREVVCYVYRDDANDVAVGGTGGISCLPFSEVKGYGG
ncbi:hypothetical protein M197_gp80 [Haloarcula hispanica tailed virus 2]|uniref:Uncharacterized protein n=1 Tax=Haloarcula hispanica tailed virus 2 TaxID=1273751 RepID=R4T6C5_9CAUD|nr:hypothetical protein M197_gp80 [Haloarcula hispanica tailed virus 2]AGM11244.1 hypothetical protein HHTV2_80 [Haloarcula hispanica tailed virus 2]